MGIGDWGLGIGDWGVGTIRDRQCPIAKPPSPLNKFIIYFEFIHK